MGTTPSSPRQFNSLVAHVIGDSRRGSGVSPDGGQDARPTKSRLPIGGGGAQSQRPGRFHAPAGLWRDRKQGRVGGHDEPLPPYLYVRGATPHQQSPCFAFGVNSPECQIPGIEGYCVTIDPDGLLRGDELACGEAWKTLSQSARIAALSSTRKGRTPRKSCASDDLGHGRAALGV